jgi:SAM-dependent methyltransferase
LNEKQHEELNFWKDLLQKEGKTGFLTHRKRDFEEKTQYFTGLHNEQGIGLDLGSGLLSIFEFSSELCEKNKIWAVDPLMDEYINIIKQTYPTDYDNLSVNYLKSEETSYIPFDDKLFDWIFCVNVYDHVPDTERLIYDIYCTLKPGGRLYFGVNFDDILWIAHYFKCNYSLVEEALSRFKLIDGHIIRNNKDSQYNYWGEYIK